MVVFRGMCDASGAVPLSAARFAVADDEDNVLRVYSANNGGDPLWQRDVSPELGLFAKPSKNPNKQKAPPETDLEAATRVGNVSLWLTSHGRNSKGTYRPERLYLFATTTPNDDTPELRIIGTPVTDLLVPLMNDPRYKPFDLESASRLPPKSFGGLNIEGMTERMAGGIWIGLRSPTPDGRALIVPLLNPLDVVRDGTAAQLGDPVLLNLGGLGVRGLSYWHGHYLIIGGHFANAGNSQLFVWNGVSPRVHLAAHQPPANFNPEGFFTPEDRDKFLLLSDDGSRNVEGTPCKKQTDPAKKNFRGVWLTL